MNVKSLTIYDSLPKDNKEAQKSKFCLKKGLKIYLELRGKHEINISFTKYNHINLGELRLTHCKLNCDFLNDFSDNLENLQVLEYLDLSSNEFQNDSVLRLLRTLNIEKNEIKILKIYDQKMTFEILLQFMDLVMKNDKLLYINSLPEDDAISYSKSSINYYFRKPQLFFHDECMHFQKLCRPIYLKDIKLELLNDLIKNKNLIKKKFSDSQLKWISKLKGLEINRYD